jgi:hypothetical protein
VAAAHLVGEGLEDSWDEGDGEGLRGRAHGPDEVDNPLEARDAGLRGLALLDLRAKLLGLGDAVLALGGREGGEAHGGGV